MQSYFFEEILYGFIEEKNTGRWKGNRGEYYQG
jgi:hypothetical protein